MPYDDEQVAEIYHSANMAHQAVTGDTMPSQPWGSLPPHLRDITVSGVRRIRAGTVTTAQEHHEAWYREMTALGYVTGEAKDPGARPPTHPALLPWAELPDLKRDKARLFVAMTQSLSRTEQ